MQKVYPSATANCKFPVAFPLAATDEPAVGKNICLRGNNFIWIAVGGASSLQ